MLKALLIFFDISILLAIGELVIFRGDSFYLLRASLPLFCLILLYLSFFQSSQRFRWFNLLSALTFAVSAVFISHSIWSHLLIISGILLALFVQQKEDSLAVRENLPLPFVLSFAFIVFFSTAASLDLREFYLLGGENVALLHYGDLFGFVTLALLCASVFGRKYESKVEAVLAKIFVSLSLLLTLGFIFSRAGGLTIPVDFEPGEQLFLGIAFTLVGARIFLKLPRSVSASSGGLLHRLSLFVCILPIAVVLVSVAYCSYLITSRNLTEKQISYYPVSEHFLIPLLVAEDPRFMRHAGIDFHRLRQVIKEALAKGQMGRGASTLTMQLAKTRFLGYDKTILRKFNQLVLALMLEQRFSKKEILFAYLESAPFAPWIVGLSIAAPHYYNVSPGDLNREQALPLVLSVYNPLEYNLTMILPSNTVRRRRAVIEGRSRVFKPVLQADLAPLEILK